jgi:hypothetical protein
MIRRSLAVSLCLAALALGVAAPAARAKITISLDYSFDTANYNFFNPDTPTGQAARAALARAASVYEDRFLDTLSPISPGSGNTWVTDLTNPGNGQEHLAISNLNIPTNTIKIFVGGRPLGGAIGLGGPGGYTVTPAAGNTTWVPTVEFRGQSGASLTVPSNDFGNWGGGISFDNSVTWNFDLAGPVPNANDFLTAATHEIAHVLGFGSAPSWKSRLTATTTPFGNVQYVGPFTGAKAMALYGGPVPLETPPTQTVPNQVINAAHLNYGTMSTVGGMPQESIMDPDITIGTRKKLTLLDWAVLDDIGWDLARPGDANADGIIDFSDLVVLAQNYNVTDGQRRWSQGDFNYDGNVDFNDLVAVAQNYNVTGAAASEALPGDVAPSFSADWAAAQQAVAPEPTALLAALSIPLFMRRPRASSK